MPSPAAPASLLLPDRKPHRVQKMPHSRRRELTTKEDAKYQGYINGCSNFFTRSANYKAHLETHTKNRDYPYLKCSLLPSSLKLSTAQRLKPTSSKTPPALQGSSRRPGPRQIPPSFGNHETAWAQTLSEKLALGPGSLVAVEHQLRPSTEGEARSNVSM